MIDKDELIFTVDEHNQPVDPQSRTAAHKDGHWHRTAHIWVRNKKGELLCQQRSLLKDTRPGFWEAHFGGHLAPDMEYIDGAVTELKEETGLTAPKENLKLWQVYKHSSDDHPNNEFQAVYLYDWDSQISDLSPEEDEVAEVKWISQAEFKRMIFPTPQPGWRYLGYEADFLKWLNKQSWGDL